MAVQSELGRLRRGACALTLCAWEGTEGCMPPQLCLGPLSLAHARDQGAKGM